VLVVIGGDWVGGCCGGCREFGGGMLEGRIRAGAISSMSSSGGSESEVEESESSSIRAWWAIHEVVSGEMFCGGVGEELSKAGLGEFLIDVYLILRRGFKNHK